MRYKIYLILFITQFASFQSAFAEDDRYRVELLVLRHLGGSSELDPQTTLRDFSLALDLLQPPSPPADEEPPSADEVAAETIGSEQTLAEDALDELTEEAVEAVSEEPQIVLLETQSEVMQQAWQRLRSSSAFKPELYLSWQQPEVKPFPSIRVHDQDVLVEDDPYADMRTNPENGKDVVPTFTDAEETTVVLPEPVRFYRIDGSASLRKTRFLHLDLDIEYREPLPGYGEPAKPSQSIDLQDGEQPRPAAFLVHTLRQSHQVQTQVMNYFDGPVFAVLALISRVEAVPEPETQGDQDTE